MENMAHLEDISTNYFRKATEIIIINNSYYYADNYVELYIIIIF